MKKIRTMLAGILSLTMFASVAVSVPAFADDVNEAPTEKYSYEVNGDTFNFYDYQHQITIENGTLKDEKDISFYGLNEEGNLAVVYFNVQENEGKSLVAENGSMVYITYSDGEISEVERSVGTMDLFGFDMSLADSSMAGMMKVFNASLGGFLGAYGTTQADYSAISNLGSLSGKVEYVQTRPQKLILKDDNYITNQETSANEAFLANEWGIYSGYQVLDGTDYSSFCFFGTDGDVYYYGYAMTDTGFKVVNMKGTVSQKDDRTKIVSLKPVSLNKTSDSASQYMTKMSSNLMGAQGKKSLNLDTLELFTTYKFTGRRFQNVIEASTSSASGTLVYKNGVYTGKIKDADGNEEELSVKLSYRNYIVTSQTAGTFTVERYANFSSSLADSNPSAQYGNYCYYYVPTNWFGDWSSFWTFDYSDLFDWLCNWY